MKAKYLIPLILFAIIAVFLGIGLKLDPRAVPSPLIGKQAPHFSLASLGNPQTMVTPGDFKGQVWLFNVWATWCVSCRAEHETLVRLGRRNIVPIVGLDWKDDAADAREWLRRLGNPYAVVATDPTGRTAIDWGVYGAPETYLVDKQGVIRFKHTGPVNPQILREEILPLIKELKEAA